MNQVGRVEKNKRKSRFGTIILFDQDSLIQDRSARDPGTFTVEDFLTEQQEAEILTEMELDTPQEAVYAGSGLIILQ